MRMYAADLAAYNEGFLVGEWLDLEGKDHDDLRAELQDLLVKWTDVALLENRIAKGEKREEYAIHDYDGPKVLSSFGEYPDLEKLAEFVEAFEKHGEAWALYVDNEGHQHADVSDFEERYQGCHQSLEAYAEQYLDETGAFEGASELLKTYFDFEKYARDLELGGDVWTVRGEDGVHVFDNH